MPGNGDDTLYFQGSLGQLSLTITNPYSGRSIELDDEYFLNSSSYDGLGGTDTLRMANKPDVLFVADGNNNQLIRNIEIIQAGNGADIVNLAHSGIILGNITLSGGNGNDILWSNDGDDVIDGGNGDDIIDGGGGNDFIYGGHGNDDLNGGDGSDHLDGGKGDDILYYNPDDVWTPEYGAYNHGSPKDPIDGDVVAVAGKNRSHDTFDGGKGDDVLYLTDGDDGLFLEDRYSDNPLGFNEARIAGIETIFTGRGNDVVDLTSKIYAYNDVTLYGEEGDDVLWTNQGNDVIVGGAGNDFMYAGYGDDLIVMGEGRDKVYGGAGSDIFRYDVRDSGIDGIRDFEAGKKGDVLDLSQIIEGFDAHSSVLSDFITLTDQGPHTLVSVDYDGAANGANFVRIAKLIDVSGLDAQTLVDDGNLLLG